MEDVPGTLTRVAGLFARRAFNIHSLAVGQTEDPAISRITVATSVDAAEHAVHALAEFDLEYLRNWSLGLDLQIIVRTVRVVLFDRNAY